MIRSLGFFPFALLLVLALWRLGDRRAVLADGNGHKMCHGLEFRYIVKSFVRSYNFRGQNVPWAWEIAPIE